MAQISLNKWTLCRACGKRYVWSQSVETDMANSSYFPVMWKTKPIRRSTSPSELFFSLCTYTDEVQWGLSTSQHPKWAWGTGMFGWERWVTHPSKSCLNYSTSQLTQTLCFMNFLLFIVNLFLTLIIKDLKIKEWGIHNLILKQISLSSSRWFVEISWHSYNAVSERASPWANGSELSPMS